MLRLVLSIRSCARFVRPFPGRAGRARQAIRAMRGPCHRGSARPRYNDFDIILTLCSSLASTNAIHNAITTVPDSVVYISLLDPCCLTNFLFGCVQIAGFRPRPARRGSRRSSWTWHRCCRRPATRKPRARRSAASTYDSTPLSSLSVCNWWLLCL